MRLMDVLGVRIELPTKQPLVLLSEREGERIIPIWIGPVEATAIAIAQESVETARPQTHELMVSVIGALDGQLESVHITHVDDGVFYAELNFDDGVTVDARPSDAIAIALRTGTDIYASEDVLDAAGMKPEGTTESEIEQFREFLDEVSPSDFDS